MSVDCAAIAHVNQTPVAGRAYRPAVWSAPFDRVCYVAIDSVHIRKQKYARAAIHVSNEQITFDRDRAFTGAIELDFHFDGLRDTARVVRHLPCAEAVLM